MTPSRAAALFIIVTASAGVAQTPPLVDLGEITPRRHRVAGFVLTAAGDVHINAVGLEPRPGRFTRNREAWWREGEDRATWPAAAWILDARTREVVWDLRGSEAQRDRNGRRRFAGTVRLAAGIYEAHYGAYPTDWTDRSDEPLDELALTITGSGRPATAQELLAAVRGFKASAIATLVPDRNGLARYAFTLARPTEVEFYAVGEGRQDGNADYGWIINADTRVRVWELSYATSEPAGGAPKNRMVRETLRLPAGRYVASFVSDDSHDPSAWNAMPAFDPEFWGLTLRIADAAARGAVRPFTYEPVPAGQTIVSLIGLGDDVSRSAGFTLRRALDVRIYAIGEGVSGDMVDYAWVVDATRRRRVWTMQHANTEPAGGSQKNRIFDGTLRLEPGSYLVYYTSDGSHSAAEWNAERPNDSRYWGVSVFPASGRLDSTVVRPFVRGGMGAGIVAELVRMGNDEDARAPFTLPAEATVRVHAVAEGGGGDMHDHGWIEEEGTGRVVWELTYRTTSPAGGSTKNRVFDGMIRLPAGKYVLRFRSDGSHAYGDWNADAPDDPESWGITVFRTGDR